MDASNPEKVSRTESASESASSASIRVNPKDLTRSRPDTSPIPEELKQQVLAVFNALEKSQQTGGKLAVAREPLARA